MWRISEIKKIAFFHLPTPQIICFFMQGPGRFHIYEAKQQFFRFHLFPAISRGYYSFYIVTTLEMLKIICLAHSAGPICLSVPLVAGKSCLQWLTAASVVASVQRVQISESVCKVPVKCGILIVSVSESIPVCERQTHSLQRCFSASPLQEGLPVLCQTKNSPALPLLLLPPHSLSPPPSISTMDGLWHWFPAA